MICPHQLNAATEEVMDLIIGGKSKIAAVEKICHVAGEMCQSATVEFVESTEVSTFVPVGTLSYPVRDDDQCLGTLLVACDCPGGKSECDAVRYIARYVKLAIGYRKDNTGTGSKGSRAYVALQRSTDAIVMTDADGSIDYLNPVAEHLLDCGLRSVVGRPVSELVEFVNIDSGQAAANPLEACLQHECDIVISNKTAIAGCEGKPVPVHGSTAVVRAADGSTVGAVMVLRDATRFEGVARRLAFLESRDPLTGLANRNEFEKRLLACIDECSHDDRGCGLMQIDIDQLKVVNDTYGHIVGDELLRQISTLIRKFAGPDDCVSRLSGDEFGLLICDRGGDAVLEIAESIRAAVEAFRFVWQGAIASVRCSIGVVIMDNNDIDAATALSAVDVACYTAKKTGRNQIHLYSDEECTPHHEEMKWVTRISSAIEDERFELYVQPIVCLRADEQQKPHFEVLLRMRDEHGRMVLPDEFIPAAEHYNLMPQLDRWVFRKVLEWRTSTPGGKSDCTFAINLSGKSLSDDRLLGFISSQLESHRLPAGAICFEITETAAISDLSRVVHFMTALRQFGCTFALDDFGTGLSSFSYLKNLPVDFLKIDGHFVRNMAVDEFDATAVRAISEVARSAGIKVIAEQVESEEVLERLRQLQIDYAQGFHIGRPRPISETSFG